MYALLDIGLLIVAAKVSERVLGRLGLHTAVACTLAGALLGPLAGIVEPTGAIPLLLGAGAVVFFFIVGLDEIDVPGVIAAARGRYFAAAAVSVGVAVLAALLVTSDLSGAGFALGLDFYAALALAGILALSSVGVVSRVLADKGLLKELAGLRMFTTVIIAEALALLLVAATISRFDYGLVAIGALVLGASVSGLPHRMRADILPGVRRAADALVVPLFFAAAGLYLDLSFSALPAATIAAVVCIPLAGKFAGALLGARLARLDTPIALATGLMAKGATEIAFLVVLLQSGAIGRGVFSLLVLVMFGYILLGPPAIGAALDRTRARERPARPRMVLPSFARHALAGRHGQLCTGPDARLSRAGTACAQLPRRMDCSVSVRLPGRGGRRSLRASCRSASCVPWPTGREQIPRSATCCATDCRGLGPTNRSTTCSSAWRATG